VADATRIAGWRRHWVASAAVIGTLAAVVVAALQLWLAWRAQNETVSASMLRYAAYAARTFGDGMEARFSDLSYRALAPVIGAGSEVGAAELPVERFARYMLRATREATPLTGDSLAGVFAITPAGPLPSTVTVHPIGTAATPAMLRALAAEALAADSEFSDLATGYLTAHDWHGTLMVVDAAWRRDSVGRAVALYGIVNDGHAFVGSAAGLIHRYALLLPPIAFRSDAAEPAIPEVAALNDAYVAVRVRAPNGALVYESANWTRPALQLSPFRARHAMAGGVTDPESGGFEVEAVLLPALRGVIENEAAARLSRLLLAGVLLVAIALAGVAVYGHKRRQELAHARERFVAAVSHELRTPLAQIRMFSEMLSNDMVRSPEQARRWLGVIHREAIRLGGLVENVLLFARGEAAGLRVAPRAADAAALVHDAVAAFGPVAAGREVTIRTETPPSAPMWADPAAVRQLLGNLLDNAVKYGPDGQTITVRVQTSATAADGEVALVVEDEGPGIPPAERERVWQPFTRLREEDGTRGGSGLGLSLVRELVVRQGGRAWVEDAAGGGARFVVTLPVAHA
jgi:signal transduction histidine kinase